MRAIWHPLLSWRPPAAEGVLGDNGLALVKLVVVFMLLRYLLNNIVGRLIVPLLARELASHEKQRAARLQTLAGVVRSTANYLLAFIVVMVGLKQFGVDTTPILASASVIGMAVGFGSQKLVRDVMTGFLLLAENQFDVGDYVTVGAVTGVVEEIGMRTTRIRDDVGKVYIVPNGDIAQVCNHTDGRMSYFIDLAVTAATDLDAVRALVEQIGGRLEEEFGENLLERPHVEGIAAMSAAQVTLRIRYRAECTIQERIQMRLRAHLREVFAREGIALA